MTNKKIKKSKANRNLSPIEQRKLESKIRRLIGKSYSDIEILEELTLQPHVLRHYKQRIYEIDKERFNHLDSVTVYTDYTEKSRQMIKELDKLKVKFSNRGQWTALVAAVKEKNVIYKDVIKLGQDFGFIERKASEITFQGEMSFATYTTEEVKKELEKEVKKLNQMAKGEIIEMRPELLETLDEDTEKIKKYFPVDIQEVQAKKTIQKKVIKKKIKLKMRH